MAGLELENGLVYSSLSMGAGEQRLIKILETVYDARAGSLILIDEIDLLLHMVALQRMIVKLSEIAKKRELQIIFTTHSPLMFDFSREVLHIQYLDNSAGVQPTRVYENITYELAVALTGGSDRSIDIYVEDAVSKRIVGSILRDEEAFRESKVTTFGAVSNAYTLASSLALREMRPTDQSKLDDSLFILDGDVDCDPGDREREVNKRIAGDEPGIEEARKRALSCITMYLSPEKKCPEQFLYDCLVKCDPDKGGYVDEARKIQAVDDPHEWLTLISDVMGEDVVDTVGEVIRLIEGLSEWKEYTKLVRDWIVTKKETSALFGN